MNKKINLIFSLCFFMAQAISCNPKNQNKNSTQNLNVDTQITNNLILDTSNTKKKENVQYQKEDTLYDIVGKIVEVAALIKKTGLKHKVNILINKRPDSEFAYFWLQVGIDDDVRFQPVYNFYINPKNLEINYYNSINDSIISLEKWRKQRGW